MFTRYNTVDQADAKDAMEKLESYFDKTEESTAEIVLQGIKGARNNLLTPWICWLPKKEKNSKF